MNPRTLKVCLLADATNACDARAADAQIAHLRAQSAQPVECVGWPLDAQAWQRLDEDDGLALCALGTQVGPNWTEGLLGHARTWTGSGCIVPLSNATRPELIETLPLELASDGPRWLEAVARLRRLWPAGCEDVGTVATPLAFLPRARRQSEVLRAAARQGPDWTLDFGAAGRVLLAHDLAVWRHPDAPAQLQVEALDASIGGNARLSSLAELRAVQGRLAELLEGGARPAARLRLAELCNLTSQYARAQEHARSCLETWPRHLDASLALAEALAHSGHGARARGLLEQMAERAPVGRRRRGALMACLGEAWRRCGDESQAEECFASALLLDAEQVLALNGRARLSIEAGEFEAAARDLRQATELEPLRAESWNNLGRALWLLGEHELGRSMLARALSINPTHREARQLLERMSLLREPRACG